MSAMLLLAALPSLHAEGGERGGGGREMSASRREELRQTVREMFYHSYDAYIRHAFPHDELRPLR